jgi:hypothetical protein
MAIIIPPMPAAGLANIPPHYLEPALQTAGLQARERLGAPGTLTSALSQMPMAGLPPQGRAMAAPRSFAYGATSFARRQRYR